jgi:hypothetical protein
MGIPLSFPFLNLIHIYVCDKIGAHPESYYIMGDDLIAVWAPRLIQRYLHMLVKLTGMMPNHTKSFISKSRGIFCERAYHLAPDGLRVNRHFLSVKAMSPSRGDAPVKGPERMAGWPDELSPLLYLDAHYERIGHSRARFAQELVLTDYASKISRLARRYKIMRYVPIKWGGAGLIPAKANWQLSAEESDWLAALFAGDDQASRRMVAVRYGEAELSMSNDKRAAKRLARSTKLIGASHDGPGLGDAEVLLALLREHCEDVASTELRATPSELPARLWFKSVGSYPTSRGSHRQGPRFTYRAIRQVRLAPDAEKTGLDRLIESIKSNLPVGLDFDKILKQDLGAESDLEEGSLPPSSSHTVSDPDEEDFSAWE